MFSELINSYRQIKRLVETRARIFFLALVFDGGDLETTWVPITRRVVRWT